MRKPLVLCVVAAAAVLALASSRGRVGAGGRGGVKGSGPFRPEKAKGLTQPALLFVNHTDHVVHIRLTGTMNRTFTVAPRGAYRTLTAAGVYKYLITCKPDNCPFRSQQGAARFLKRRRYVLILGK